MSMYNDIVWGEKRKRMLRIANSQNRSRLCNKDSRTDIGRCLGLDQKRNGTELTRAIRTGKWDRVAEDMMLNFSESGHHRIPWIQCFGTRRLESCKGKGKLSVHFCFDDKTVEVVLRTIISVNQLSIYGAVADMFDELACRISGCSERTGKLVAQNNPEITVIPTELTTTNKSPRTDDNVQETCCRITNKKFANLPEHLQLIKLCSNAGITKTVARRQYFTTLDDAELDKLGGPCREDTLPRDNAASKVKGWIRGNTKIGPALQRWQSVIIKAATESRS